MKNTHSFDNFVDHFDASCDLFISITKNETVKVFFGIICILIRTSLSFFHTAFPSNADFGPTFALHFLQTVSTRSHKQTKKVNLRKFFDGNVNFVRRALRALLLMVFDGWAEVGVVLHSTIDELDTFVFELFAVTNFTSVGPTTMSIVRGRGRSRPKGDQSIYAHVRYKYESAPFSLGRNEVVQPKLAIDLFETQVDSIVIQLGLRNSSSRDGSGQTRYFGFGVSPTAPTFTRSIRIN